MILRYMKNEKYMKILIYLDLFYFDLETAIVEKDGCRLTLGLAVQVPGPNGEWHEVADPVF